MDKRLQCLSKAPFGSIKGFFCICRNCVDCGIPSVESSLQHSTSKWKVASWFDWSSHYAREFVIDWFFCFKMCARLWVLTAVAKFTNVLTYDDSNLRVLELRRTTGSGLMLLEIDPVRTLTPSEKWMLCKELLLVRVWYIEKIQLIKNGRIQTIPTLGRNILCSPKTSCWRALVIDWLTSRATECVEERLKACYIVNVTDV